MNFGGLNLKGSQVVDALAICESSLYEFSANEHTRSRLEELIPKVGDFLYSIDVEFYENLKSNRGL